LQKHNEDAIREKIALMGDISNLIKVNRPFQADHIFLKNLESIGRLIEEGAMG